MRATSEPLEANKVKVKVEVDEAELEKALEKTYRRMSKEVRFPGFRPGKVPRRVLEARLGADKLRSEALTEALPDFYSQALVDADVDAIAAPHIEITEGRESGPLQLDAVVEGRPVIPVPGYDGLQVTLPDPKASDAEVDTQIERLRQRMSHVEVV